MMTALAVIAAVGAYFLTMAGLLMALGTIRFNVPAFGWLNVQPYRSVAKWVVIGTSGFAAYVAFLGASN